MGELHAGQHSLLKRCQPNVTLEPPVHEDTDPRDSRARDDDARPQTTEAHPGALQHSEARMAGIVGVGRLRPRRDDR